MIPRRRRRCHRQTEREHPVSARRLPRAGATTRPDAATVATPPAGSRPERPACRDPTCRTRNPPRARS